MSTKLHNFLAGEFAAATHELVIGYVAIRSLEDLSNIVDAWADALHAAIENDPEAVRRYIEKASQCARVSETRKYPKKLLKEKARCRIDFVRAGDL